MSEEQKSETTVDIKKVGAIASALAGVVGLLGAWVVLPYRVQAAESKIIELQIELKATREILIRIDENVKDLKDTRRTFGGK